MVPLQLNVTQLLRYRFSACGERCEKLQAVVTDQTSRNLRQQIPMGARNPSCTVPQLSKSTVALPVRPGGGTTACHQQRLHHHGQPPHPSSLLYRVVHPLSTRKTERRVTAIRKRVNHSRSLPRAKIGRCRQHARKHQCSIEYLEGTEKSLQGQCACNRPKATSVIIPSCSFHESWSHA